MWSNCRLITLRRSGWQNISVESYAKPLLPITLSTCLQSWSELRKPQPRWPTIVSLCKSERTRESCGTQIRRSTNIDMSHLRRTAHRIDVQQDTDTFAQTTRHGNFECA